MNLRRWVGGLAAATVLLVTSGTVASANPGSVIDFESGFAAGNIVTTLSHPGQGISGDSTSVQVTVSSTPGDRAMIYDAECPPDGPDTCTGGDDDLYAPAQGNILIVSEDGLSSNPDDINGPNTISFVFSAPVTLEQIWTIDNEEGLTINMYSSAAGGAGDLIHTITIPPGTNGDRGVQVVGLDDTPGVVRVDFLARGSIGYDDLMFFVPLGGGEGCTPGYWKNHTDRWVGYSPSDSFNTVFGVNAAGNPTLLQAAEAGGGGAIALGRHAVAALLNASNPDVESGQTEAEVKAIVQNAYATGNFEAAKDILEDINEQGCPLGGSSATTGGGNSNANANANKNSNANANSKGKNK